MREVTIVEDDAGRRWIANAMTRLPLLVFKLSTALVLLIGGLLVANGVTITSRIIGLVFMTVGAPVIMSGAILAIYPIVRWLPQTWTIDSNGIVGRGRSLENVPWSAITIWGIEPVSALPGYSHLQLRWKTAWRRGKLNVVAPPGMSTAVIEEYFHVFAPAAERSSPGAPFL